MLSISKRVTSNNLWDKLLHNAEMDATYMHRDSRWDTMWNKWSPDNAIHFDIDIWERALQT
jgi:hypothetical protein